MKCKIDLASEANTPRLVPTFKQSERRLLSVFMALLQFSPAIRSEFLKKCGFGSARTASCESFMEVSYKGSKYPDCRPDGLIACRRGKTEWSTFIEAKADKATIRTEQVNDYIKLAALAGVDTVITISNEFSRQPDEPPYTLTGAKKNGAKIYHFAWADIRTFLELKTSDAELSEFEHYVLSQVLEFMWEDGSGVATYDAMPESWPAFVEASSTALGFNSNIKGFSEIIYGWQQERRDLCSKLTHRLGGGVALLHSAGARADDDTRAKADRLALSEEYLLAARYKFESSALLLDLVADLRACRITAALDVPIPADKGAQAISTWLAKVLQDVAQSDLSLCFDWPGNKHDLTLSIQEFLAEPGLISHARKDAPKAIRILTSQHGVRRFKSRKMIIEDVEAVAHRLVDVATEAGWLQ